MPKMLTIEIRNKDFGPVKGGKFFDAQIQCTKNFGVGDGLFAPPRDEEGKTQFGFEELIQPIVTVAFKDGTTVQRKEDMDKEDFPLPGKSQNLEIELPANKAYHDILTVNLSFEDREFRHSSRSGGMSVTGLYIIGSSTIDGARIPFDGKIVAVISLSNLWDLSIPWVGLSTDRHEFININFYNKSTVIRNTNWKNVELIEDWRSQLADHWPKNPDVQQEYNLHSSFKFVIPINVFAPGKKGWVIGIKDRSCVTTTMERHLELFSRYAETPEYKAENEAYCNWYFRGQNAPTTSAASQQADATAQIPTSALRP